MAQWRKVVVSGSSAVLNEVSASGNIVPKTTDGSSLGTSALQFSDLFLGEGAVINWDGGDFTATQTNNLLTLSGGNTRVDKLEIDGANDSIDVSTDMVLTAAADITLAAGGANVKPNADNTIALGVSGTAWSDLFLGDGAVINFNAGDVTATHSSNLLSIAGGNTRVIRLEIDSASDYLDVSTDLQVIAAADITLDPAGGNVKPASNDDAALGVAGTGWSDLFLAEGAVINWDSGDFTATQANNLLTLSGGNTRVDRLELDSASDYLDVDTDLKIVANADISLEPGGSDVLIGGNRLSGSAASTGSFGYLNVHGDGVFGGNVTFGDAATDSISFGADINSNLIPNTDDTYDLGSASQAWQDLFLEGDITFSDAGTISTTAGNLTVDSLAATLVLDGHTGVDIDASDSGKVAIDGAGGIDIGVAADVAIDIDSAALDIDASGAITIDSTSTILISGDGGATFSDDTEALVYDGSGNLDFDTVALDIDSSGAITIDGTSTVSIDGADDMNFTITSGTGGEDLTIAQLGANDSSIIIEAAGTGTDAIKIDATAGSMVIAPSLANAKTLTIGPASATQMVFTPHGTAASEKISLINTSGTADDAIKIDSVAGGLTLAAGNDSLHIDADGTDSDALNIDSAGGIDVDAAAAVDILAATTLSVKGATSATFGDDTEHLVYDGSGNVDFDAVALDIDASGAVTIDGATTVAIAGASTSTYGDDVAKWSFDGTGKLSTTGVTTVSVTPSGVMDIDSGGALTIDGTSITIGGDDSGVAISIGHSTSETTINDNLTITGDLTVNGDQTIISTTNLAVEDKFAVFASGSTSATDGGIIVSKQADGAGFALGYDIGTSRWVLDDNLAIAATDIVPDAYVGTVELGTTAGDTQSAPKYGSGAGSIYIKTDDNEIWIYA